MRAPEWRGTAQPPPEPPRSSRRRKSSSAATNSSAICLRGPRGIPLARRPEPVDARGTSTAIERGILRGRKLPNCLAVGQRRRPEPRPKLTPEEIQQQLNEAFGALGVGEVASRARSIAPPTSLIPVQGQRPRDRLAVAPPALRRAGQEPFQDRQERRAGSLAASFAKAGRVESGRCWMHGRASLGPKSPEGKTRRVRSRDGRGAAQVG